MDWSHNGEITFRRNSANYGGAIFAMASGTSNFIGNGDIAFRWNLASGGELGEACGGAIELDNDAALSFSGNGNIVFEGNLAVSRSVAHELNFVRAGVHEVEIEVVSVGDGPYRRTPDDAD